MGAPKPPASPGVAPSPEQTIERNLQNGQAIKDRSLDEGDKDELSDGGAKSSRHTGDESRHSPGSTSR